ncbi:retrovirus-related pol polyprotein from transposon TNT 1-94 [Tanacetum coccineum]
MSLARVHKGHTLQEASEAIIGTKDWISVYNSKRWKAYVQAMPSLNRSNGCTHSETEINSDSNIIPYSKRTLGTRPKDIVNIIMNSSVDNASVNVHECEKCLKLETELLNKKDFSVEIFDLNVSLQEKVLKITALKDELRKLKGKALVDHAYTENTLIGSRDGLDCMYAKLIQELLTHISKTCPSVNNTDGKLVVVTPKNKDKRVRFTEPITSSGYTITKTASTSNLVSNKLMLSSIGVKTATSASGSQPLEQNKKDKILQHQQLCDLNLEVAFRQHTCFIRNLEGVDLLTGSRGNNLYTLSLGDMMASSPICLLSKASKTKYWLWHRRLSYLNFDTNQEKLYLLHMDLCGPIRVASINGKKYILVIVDDYSRFTWVKCLRSKDEAPDFIIKFLNMTSALKHLSDSQNSTETEFVNQTLREYYEKVGISHETSVDRSPQQNSVVERRNRTLIEAARTMLIYAKAPLFLWVEAVATACYTQNRSIIRLRHGKTPYELLHDKPPDLSFFHVFGALCYLTNDSKNLDWDTLFQPIFDELLTPSPSVDYSVFKVVATIHVVVAPVPVVSTCSSTSTNVDQDAPSPSHSQTTTETQPPVIPNDVEKDNHDIVISHMGNDPYFGIPIPEIPSDQSLLSDSIHTIIEAMQEELNEFKRLEVWELVPRPHKVMVITLKWIYKVKLDELGGRCALAYQAWPTEKHLHAVKRIFRYLKGTVNRGLWYPKDSSIALTTFADADHAGCCGTP